MKMCIRDRAMMESYHELLPGGSERRVSLETALETVRSLDRKLSELTEQKNELLAQRAALQAVSYTHLDVYKRQVKVFGCKFHFHNVWFLSHFLSLFLTLPLMILSTSLKER